jgi:hypothetical protein
VKNYKIEHIMNAENFSNFLMAMVHLSVSAALVLFVYVF